MFRTLPSGMSFRPLLMAVAIAVVRAAVLFGQDWTLSFNRSGPLRVEMTSAEVRNALNDPLATLVAVDASASSCRRLQSVQVPPQVTLMFKRDRLVRINVRDVGPRTEAGAGVGDTEERLRAIYQDQLEVVLHPYLDESVGHYLLVHTEPKDHDFGMILSSKHEMVV